MPAVPYPTIGDLTLWLNMMGCLIVELESFLIARYANVWGDYETNLTCYVCLAGACFCMFAPYIFIFALTLVHVLLWKILYTKKKEEKPDKWFCKDIDNIASKDKIQVLG